MIFICFPRTFGIDCEISLAPVISDFHGEHSACMEYQQSRLTTLDGNYLS